ncbi:MAG: hypothetical protein CLLPBCKN_004907 [Chroococcidiopsis cubana SAG 39.79]|nr:hypothetical protein [Chroococcidiopsis cubana SAG 39.79]
MLLARRPQNPNPDELVFPSPKGEAMVDNIRYKLNRIFPEL